MQRSSVCIFLSHATRHAQEHALAHTLAERLNAMGAEVWIAPESIRPGERWQESLVDGVLTKCSHFLVIVSSVSIRSEWVIKEIELAQQRFGRGDLQVLPLVVEEPEQMPPFLSGFQTIRFEGDTEEQVRKVADAVGVEYLPPPPPRQHEVETATLYLRRCVHEDELSIRKQRWGRVWAGAPGVAVAVAMLWLYPVNVRLATMALVGMPAITVVLGLGIANMLTTEQNHSQKMARELENQLNACGDDPCTEVWEHYQRYRKGRLGKLMRQEVVAG